MSNIERKPGVGCDKLLMGGYHCGRPGEGLCSRCWAIQHDEDAASLRKQLEGAVEALRQVRDLLTTADGSPRPGASLAIGRIDVALRDIGGQ